MQNLANWNIHRLIPTFRVFNLAELLAELPELRTWEVF